MKLKVIGSSSKGNAYALIASDEILLLECGCKFSEVKKAIEYQFLKIKGCLVTHEHQDHLKFVREYLNAGIPVYTNDETQEDVEVIIGERLYGMPEKIPFNIGGYKIIPFYVPHGDTPCFAYLIEHEEMGRLLFATDYEYLPYSFRKWQIEHFLIEANYRDNFVDSDMPNYNHVLTGHASLKTCLNVIEANKSPNLRTVTMCHLSGFSGSVEGFTTEMKKVSGIGVWVDCAEPGMTVELFKDPF